MQNWSDSICKLVISIPNLARKILQACYFNYQSGQNNSENQGSKLVRLNLQTNDSNS